MGRVLASQAGGGKGRAGCGAEVLGRAGSRKVELGPPGGSSSSMRDERRVVQGRGGAVVFEAWKPRSIALLVPVRALSSAPPSGLSPWEALPPLPPAGRTGWAPQGANAFIEGGLGGMGGREL